MADKATKRERREAAKRARLEAQRRAVRARRLRRIYGAVGVLVVVGGIVALILWNNQKSARERNALNDAAVAAGCSTLQSPEEGARDHTDEDVQYPTNPPTSGPHAGGVYPTGGPATQTIPEETLVHNLEHGHVILHYKPDVSESIRTSLEDVARANIAWTLSQPNPDLAGQVAFAAWGNMITCEEPKDPALVRAIAQRFVDSTRDSAPESFEFSPPA